MLGVVFSVSRSRYALPVQLLFLVLNGLGVVFGTIYNVKTPDRYEHNAHHTIGWIATWVMTVQVTMALIFTYSGRFKKTPPVQAPERASLLPITTESMAQHNMQPYHDYRWSGDSGQGNSRASTLNSRDASPTDSSRREHLQDLSKEEIVLDETDNNVEQETVVLQTPPRQTFLRNTYLDKFLLARIPGMLSHRALKALQIVYSAIDFTILVLGFIALTTGGVTYAGIFVSLKSFPTLIDYIANGPQRAGNVFGGLAHFIKGGIFFWYGLLTLGRWMGCFADLGWAWNIKPTQGEVGQWKASLPSAEFVESFVIFLYGSTNVFLEHLTAWGDAWSAQDLEHISITVMFFGGGLVSLSRVLVDAFR